VEIRGLFAEAGHHHHVLLHVVCPQGNGFLPQDGEGRGSGLGSRAVGLAVSHRGVTPVPAWSCSSLCQLPGAQTAKDGHWCELPVRVGFGEVSSWADHGQVPARAAVLQSEPGPWRGWAGWRCADALLPSMLVSSLCSEVELLSR